MIRALYTAASGMSAQQMNLDTIANNLANSSTTGFRQLRLQFQDMVYQNLVTLGAAQSQSTVSAGLQIGLGTKSAATEVINTQGSLNETDNQYDLAIEGANQGVIPGTMNLILVQREAEMMQRSLTFFHTEFNKIATEELPRV